MSHDAHIFISYAKEDETAAEKVCRALEADDLPCWYSERNLYGGETFGREIVKAISDCRLMLVILSSHANESNYVASECDCAVRKEKPILPLRIENVEPGEDLELHLHRRHWVNAWTPPLESHYQHLIESVRKLLEKTEQEQTRGRLRKQSDSTVLMWDEAPPPTPNEKIPAGTGVTEEDEDKVTGPLPLSPLPEPAPVEPPDQPPVEQVPKPPRAGAAAWRELIAPFNNRWVIGAAASVAVIVLLIIVWRSQTPGVRVGGPEAEATVTPTQSPPQGSETGSTTSADTTESTTPIVDNPPPQPGEKEIIPEDMTTDVREEGTAASATRDGNTLFYIEEDYPEAAKQYLIAVNEEPENPKYHSNLANALFLQLQHAKAEVHYRRAIELAEKKPELYGTKANHHEKLAMYHDNLGDVLRGQNKDEDAEKEYRTAKELAPNNSHYHNDLGYVLYKQGYRLGKKAEKAKAEVRAKLREEARAKLNEAVSHHTRALELINKQGGGDTDKVKNYKAQYHLNLGNARNELGDTGSARKEYNAAQKFLTKTTDPKVQAGVMDGLSKTEDAPEPRKASLQPRKK